MADYRERVWNGWIGKFVCLGNKQIALQPAQPGPGESLTWLWKGSAPVLLVCADSRAEGKSRRNTMTTGGHGWAGATLGWVLEGQTSDGAHKINAQ